jgi:ribulose-phosphate 3-epimerase
MQPKEIFAESAFEIAPSILSADFTRLAEEIEIVKKGGATVLHVDVMDGRFVPNITIGLPVVESIRKVTDMTIDCHLMIVEPSNYAVDFVKAGANMVSVHVEADNHLHRTLTAIQEAGGRAGVAINPGTPLSAIEEVLPYADFVLVMSVNPGFGGQRFVPTVLDKVRRLKEMIISRGLQTKIEIDGGVGEENINEVVAAGAEIIVAGSAIYGKDKPDLAVEKLIENGTIWT